MPGALLGGVLIGVTEALAACCSRRPARACSPSAFWFWCCCSGRRACSARGWHDRALDRRSCRAATPSLLVALLAAFLAAPWIVNDYLLTVLIIILYFAYAGQAWNIMMGFAGQLSLGHAIYLGLGRLCRGDFVRSLRHRSVAWPAGGSSRCRGLWRGYRLSGVPLRRSRRLFRHFDHRLCRVCPHRLRSFGLRQRFERPVPAGQAIRPQRCVAAARRPDHVLLRHPGRDRARLRALPFSHPQPRRLFLAGHPRGRASGARRRHRHLPLQDVRGDGFRGG